MFKIAKYYKALKNVQNANKGFIRRRIIIVFSTHYLKYIIVQNTKMQKLVWIVYKGFIYTKINV